MPLTRECRYKKYNEWISWLLKCIICNSHWNGFIDKYKYIKSYNSYSHNELLLIVHVALRKLSTVCFKNTMSRTSPHPQRDYANTLLSRKRVILKLCFKWQKCTNSTPTFSQSQKKKIVNSWQLIPAIKKH